jgi:hypothetical protein
MIPIGCGRPIFWLDRWRSKHGGEFSRSVRSRRDYRRFIMAHPLQILVGNEHRHIRSEFTVDIIRCHRVIERPRECLENILDLERGGLLGIVNYSIQIIRKTVHRIINCLLHLCAFFLYLCRLSRHLMYPRKSIAGRLPAIRTRSAVLPTFYDSLALLICREFHDGASRIKGSTIGGRARSTLRHEFLRIVINPNSACLHTTNSVTGVHSV